MVKVNGKQNICEVWGLQDLNLLSLMGNVSKEATKSVPIESYGAVVKEEPCFQTKWCPIPCSEHELSFSQIRMGIYTLYDLIGNGILV